MILWFSTAGLPRDLRPLEDECPVCECGREPCEELEGDIAHRTRCDYCDDLGFVEADIIDVMKDWEDFIEVDNSIKIMVEKAA